MSLSSLYLDMIPNVDSLGIIMEALSRRGQVTPALHLLEVMT